MMQKIIKVGNSYAVILPKSIMEEMGLSLGDTLISTIRKNPLRLELVPVRKKIDETIFNQEIVDFALKVENDRLTVEEIADWLKTHTKK